MHKIYFENGEEREYNQKYGFIYEAEQLQEETTNLRSSRSLSSEQKTEKIDYDHIMRDLFIWAILMNRISMAKMLLCFMKYRICPALIATKVLKAYHKKAVYGELKKGYEKDAQYFEQYAIRCLDQCNDEDPEKACEIILQQNPLYGHVTCLQVQSKKFFERKL